MKKLKLSRCTFISYFMFSFIPIIGFLIAYLYVVINNGPQLKDLFFLLPISLFAYYLYYVINYYLYDKDTIIEIDAYGNVTYNNLTQKHFHLEDIDFCTKLGPDRLYIGMTEITLKDGSRIDVSNFISLEYIYKMNPKIEIKRLGYYRIIILKRGEQDIINKKSSSVKVGFQETIKQRTDKELEIISKDLSFYSEEERLLALNELKFRNSIIKKSQKCKYP